MTKIVRGGQSGSLDHINSSQATFRSQIAALTDAVRQLGGAAEIGSGAVTNDPLNAPYVLYVNPYTGSDRFVGGNYSTSGSATQRIDLQRLECGYTESRPFRTINRAIIEAGIITAKSYYESPLTNNDLVSIVLMPGAGTVLNGTGIEASSMTEWASGKDPTDEELTAFNPNSTGGIILPRGISLCGLDLRKTILRPSAVPAAADEASDASNRRAIFKVTGTGYYFGFTFMDKAGSTASHHLLHAFEFAGKSELDEFYSKIQKAFGGTNNTGGISNPLAVTRTAEYEIVGPQPIGGSQTINTDTTLSASPYIFNCSIRSNYGLCGVYADGAKTSGFRSLVIAQFTGVSLQRDLSCWQKYDSGSSPRWGATFSNYADYISTDPDNVRMHPSRRSFHIRAVNDAVIQEVSVFAIGQGIHHWTQSGGEITITNSNSNFGGCAAISEGYKTAAFNADKNWVLSRIRVANNLSALTNNVKKIYLGTISAVTSSSITLTTSLSDSETLPGTPDLLAREGYTLRTDSYLWVENPLGKDWRSTLTSSAWSSGTPAQLNITAALTDEDSTAVGTTGGVSNAIGKRVYIRRLVDTRTPSQRTYSIKINTTDSAVRTPVRDYVLQVTTGGASINNAFSSSSVLQVGNVSKIPTSGGGVLASAEMTLRRGNASETWTSTTVYKRGDTVKLNDKHYTCIKDNKDSTFDTNKWQESFVHMTSDYNPEDFYKNEAPILTFDNDTDGTQASTTLGYNLSTVWTNDSAIQTQYRSATDYKSLHLFLTSIGFTSAQAHTILVPKAEASRDRNPSSSSDMGGYTPSGAANALDNWPLEFRRPSVIRLFGHAWEWTGYLNYTKAIPTYQKELSPQNKFTYYFTNVSGGRVYATGFNEEGFQVTPRGLEDLVTGATLSVEDLGASDINLQFPTSYENLQATTFTSDNVTVNSSLTISGSVSIGSTALSQLAASTTAPGIGTIASISDLTNPTAASSDSDLNTAGPRFVTPRGLVKLGDSRYSPILSSATKRLFVLPSGSSLPANAATYPLIEGGTVNLNNVTTYTSIQAAYASLPLSFTLAEGDHIDIYLLASTIDMGTITTDGVVGSKNPDKQTYIIPYNWDDNSIQQVIKYTLSNTFTLGVGPFFNCTFYTINPAVSKIAIKGRVKLEATAVAVTSSDSRQTGVVGKNISSSNLLVELKTPDTDTVRRNFVIFHGANFSPYMPHYRHNERPIYFGLTLSGSGSLIAAASNDSLHGYPVCVFAATEDAPVYYGAAMCSSATLASYVTDAERREATALYEFTNNKTSDIKILFHYLYSRSKIAVDGAAYTGYLTNITWAIKGSSKLKWRLFGFSGLFSEADGSSCPSATATFTSRGIATQTWGGFINENSSTREYSTAHYPGHYCFVQSQATDWGVFGAGGQVTAANSLLGADGSGYYLRPLASRYAIVIPTS